MGISRPLWRKSSLSCVSLYCLFPEGRCHLATGLPQLGLRSQPGASLSLGKGGRRRGDREALSEWHQPSAGRGTAHHVRLHATQWLAPAWLPCSSEGLTVRMQQAVLAWSRSKLRLGSQEREALGGAWGRQRGSVCASWGDRLCCTNSQPRDQGPLQPLPAGCSSWAPCLPRCVHPLIGDPPASGTRFSSLATPNQKPLGFSEE